MIPSTGLWSVTVGAPSKHPLGTLGHRATPAIINILADKPTRLNKSGVNLRFCLVAAYSSHLARTSCANDAEAVVQQAVVYILHGRYVVRTVQHVYSPADIALNDT